MATLQIQNLPDDLYNQLHELATQHHQSIDKQVISLLLMLSSRSQRSSIKAKQLNHP